MSPRREFLPRAARRPNESRLERVLARAASLSGRVTVKDCLNLDMEPLRSVGLRTGERYPGVASETRRFGD